MPNNAKHKTINWVLEIWFFGLFLGLDLDSPSDDDFSPQRIIELFEKLLREGKSISIAATSNNEDDEGNS